MLTTETIKQWRSDAENIARRSCEYETEYSAAEAILALTAELLANREAQPVDAGKFAGYGLYHAERDEFGSWLKSVPEDDNGDAITKYGYVSVKLYTAPPAPAVPDEMPRQYQNGWPLDYSEYASGWNACRAAMLAAVPEGGNDHDTRR
ncbi:hypothetical protein JEQ01_03120 [Serratia marcescens]|nr:hypothetical protein [Serratia marcescens]